VRADVPLLEVRPAVHLLVVRRVRKGVAWRAAAAGDVILVEPVAPAVILASVSSLGAVAVDLFPTAVPVEVLA
jgi:hypothetical protein